MICQTVLCIEATQELAVREVSMTLASGYTLTQLLGEDRTRYIEDCIMAPQ